MQFLKVNWHVPNLYKYHVEKYGDFNSVTPYTTQSEFFYSKYYWPGNALERAMSELGYKCNSLIFANQNSCSILDLGKAWSAEYNVEVSDVSEYRILIKQIAYYNPEVLYLQDGYMYDANFFKVVREEAKNIKLIIGSCGTFVNDRQLENSKGLDMIFAISENIADIFQSKGIKTFVIRHAFDEDILLKVKISDANRLNKVCFIGTLIEKFNDTPCHKDRIETIEHFLNKSNVLDLFSPQNFLGRAPNPLFGIDMFNKQAEYLIALNVHANNAEQYAANVRLFETMGIGQCALTDYKSNMDQLFDLNKEVIVYHSKEEALDKAKFLLENPNIAMKIGQNAKNRIHQEHTYYHRAKEIDNILKAIL